MGNIKIECIEDHPFSPGEDVHRYLIKHVIIQTATRNEEIVSKLFASLESTIKDKVLLETVLKNFRDIFEEMRV